jgi:DNA-directed RNA polymerase subunit F
MTKNKWYTKPLKNGMSEMKTNYITDKKIYNGMYEVARKRSDREEAQAKKEAWEYLHKYIEHFWD